MNSITKKTLDEVTDIEIDNSMYIYKSIEKKDVLRVNIDGKYKYIGSAYYPSEDTKKIIQDISKCKLDSTIILFGLGTGEYLLEIIKSTSEYNKIVIVEPEIKIIKKFKEFSYFNEIVDKENIYICTVNEYLENIFLAVIDEDQYYNIVYAAYANYYDLYEEKYKVFLKSLRDVMFFKRTNINTGLRFSEKFFRCFINNFPIIIKSTTINNFKDKFKEYPAIIVSAGPSLDKNIKLLKKVKDNFVIIAQNRTLSPLLEEGIIPHFVCAVDTSELVYEMVENNINCKVPLIFTETTNSSLVNKYKGEKIFFKYNYTDTGIDKILEEEIDSLYSGGSVAHFSTDFAYYIGCNPIIFVGQDFAYTYDKHHSTNTERSFDLQEKDTIQVKDISGNMVKTTEVLNVFRKLMQEYIEAKDDVKFINASAGGANIEGTSVMDLEQVFCDFGKRIGINIKINNIMENKAIRNYMSIYNNVSCRQTKLMELCEKLIEAINLSNKLIDSKDIDYIRSKIGSLYKINDYIENAEELDLINFLISEVFTLSAPEFSYKLDDRDNLKNFESEIYALKHLYERMLECIESANPILVELIKKLQQNY